MISIIIPVLNEEPRILKLLDYLDEYCSGFVSEIIVVDGGSKDRTAELVKNQPDVLLITSKKGRAKQMNAGAKAAKGKVLYFLHADSFPPSGFDREIMEQFQNNNKAGCFQMKFDKNHWWLILMGWFTKFNYKAFRGGDQSLFVESDLFREIGGFDENFIVYEDNDFIAKLYQKKEFVVIQKWLTTSARRYEQNGVWQLQYHFARLHLKKFLGASPESIHHYYKRKIS
jgi:hypothetical protein